MSFDDNTIKPKLCTYGCNVEIYWNIEKNDYWELNTKKKHVCPTRVKKYPLKPMFQSVSSSNSTKSISYYESNVGKSFNYLQHPKTSHSFELLTGLTIVEIQKKYEILTEIIIAAKGKVQRSQLERDPTTGKPGMLVYYEVPQGQISEVKRKFGNSIKNTVLI
jgi:hypothetical protein